MSRIPISTLKTLIQGYFTSGTDKWTGQEVEDSFTDVIDSVGSVQTALTDAATITWDLNNGNVAYVTLGGNRTLSITNLSTPSFGILKVKQDGSGNRTLTLPAGSIKPSGFALSTAGNAIDVLGFWYDGTNYMWFIDKNFV